MDRLRRAVPAILSIAILVLAFLAMHSLTGQFHLRDVQAAFALIPFRAFVIALCATGASYAMLTQYERLAVRQVGSDLSYPRLALTSFIAYAVGHNLGVSALSGGAIRYRMYSAAGLSATQITQIIGLGSLTFFLGATTLTGLSLITNAGLGASLLHASPLIARVCGVLALGVVGGWLVFGARRRKPIMFRGVPVAIPSVSLTLRQIAVSCADLLLSCAVPYVLLSSLHEVPFLAFAGLYVVALSAGAISALPGGLGVFESVFVLLLPGVPPADLLAVLIGYRLVYYLLPFLFAVLLVSGHEIHRQRAHVSRIATWFGKSLALIAPQAIAFLVFGAGLLLLLSGSTPAVGERLHRLAQALPLPVIEISHLAGSAVGVALLILARGLYRRLDGAWLVTIWLLGVGSVASLLKGFDWEEALMLALVALALVATRREFYRRTSLLAEPLHRAWVAAIASALIASLAVVLLAYGEVPYSQQLWWQFAFDANAPRSMRAGMLVALVAGSFGLLRLLGPMRSRSRTEKPADPVQVAAAVRVAEDCTANLALLGDKSLMMSETGKGFVMYGVSGNTWIAMGDPVGPAAEFEDQIWQFREAADRAGSRAAFYQIRHDQLFAYVDAGFVLSKLGEEARMDLSLFSLEGPARADLRQGHRRAQRDGLTFRIASPGEYPQIRESLKKISDEWLRDKEATEKGFSLGFFDDAYLGQFPIAMVSHHGTLVAFANIWDTDARRELSIDLMRHTASAPKSTMDFLFVEIMLWGKSAGYEWFSLGMAPLSGLEAHRLAPAWHKLGRFVYRFGGEFYNFEGLRAYKEKFGPQWRPRYLAAPGRLSLARVLLDVTSLISRGDST